MEMETEPAGLRLHRCRRGGERMCVMERESELRGERKAAAL
jgi:hypothetical protein